ncbi:MAG TPA: AAA family ATPase [Acidobacteriota bacterium]|nr:AAA family ATPase [Acidobacteriota bacterium]
MIAAFMNMKGGVGKTTLCVQLAGAAAEQMKRVLIIDCDPQYNATQHLMKPEDYFELDEKRRTIYDVLQPSVQAPSPFRVALLAESPATPKVKDIAHTLFHVKRGQHKGVVDLAPGSQKLMYLVLGKSQGTIKPMQDRLESFVSEAERAYDIVFIDCHPSGSFLTTSAIALADLVVTPVIPDSYSQRGLVLMGEFLRYIAKFSTRQRTMRIVFNMIPNGGDNDPVLLGIRRHPLFRDLCVNAVLHRSNSIATAGRVQGSTWKRLIPWSRKPWSSRVKREFNNIYDELFGV